MHHTSLGIWWGRGVGRALLCFAFNGQSTSRSGAPQHVCLSVCLRGFTSLFCQSVQTCRVRSQSIARRCLLPLHDPSPPLHQHFPSFTPRAPPLHPLPFQSNALRLPISTRRSRCSCIVTVTCITIQARPHIHGYSGYRLACRRP